MRISRIAMEKDISNTESPQKSLAITIDMLRLSRIRAKLFLIAFFCSLLWFVLQPLHRDSYIEYIIQVVVPGAIGISASVGVSTYLIGFALKRNDTLTRRTGKNV